KKQTYSAKAASALGGQTISSFPSGNKNDALKGLTRQPGFYQSGFVYAARQGRDRSVQGYQQAYQVVLFCSSAINLRTVAVSFSTSCSSTILIIALYKSSEAGLVIKTCAPSAANFCSSLIAPVSNTTGICSKAA